MKMKILLSICVILTLVSSTFIEISEQLIKDRIQQSQSHLDALLQQVWDGFQQNRKDKLVIEFSTFKLINPGNINAMCEVRGYIETPKIGRDDFVITGGLMLFPMESFSLLKNQIAINTEVRSIENKASPVFYLRVERAIQNYASRLFEWTHATNFKNFPDQFIIEHFMMFCALKTATGLQGSDNSLVLSFNSEIAKDQVYPFDHPYLGVYDFDGQFMEEQLKYHLSSRVNTKFTRILHYMGTEEPLIDILKSLLPEIEEMYPREKPMEIMMMPDTVDQEAFDMFKNQMKVNISSDNLVLLEIPMPADIGVYENQEEGARYERQRKGFIVLRIKVTLNRTDEKEIHFKIEGGLKRVKIQDLEGQELDDEASAIFGLTNLGLRRVGAAYRNKFDILEKKSYLRFMGLKDEYHFGKTEKGYNFAFEKSDKEDVGEFLFSRETIVEYSQNFFNVENDRAEKMIRETNPILDHMPQEYQEEMLRQQIEQGGMFGSGSQSQADKGSGSDNSKKVEF